jgi:hypothetical protein
MNHFKYHLIGHGMSLSYSAVTNYHKFSDLNTTNLFFHGFGSLLNGRAASSWGSGKQFVPCLFQVPGTASAFLGSQPHTLFLF